MSRFKRFAPHTSTGLSLVELMISIALVAIILAGVVKLYADSHRSFLSNEGVARTQEGMRYALDHISRSAARAGYMGCADFFADTGGAGDNLEVLLNNDVVGVGARYNFTSPVSGIDSGDPDVADTLILRSAQSSTGLALSSQMVNAGDVLRVDDAQLTNSGIEVGDVLVVSDCNRSTVFMATAVGGGQIAHDNTSVSDGQSNSNANFGYIFGREGRSLATVYSADETAVVYTIGDSAAGDCTAAPEFCALLSNGNELLQGVENMQVQYGVQGAGGIHYRDASAVTVAEWRSVVSVRVTLTINSVTRSFTSEGDSLVRKQVSRVIALRNNNL